MKGKRTENKLRAEYRLSSNDPHLTKNYRTVPQRIDLLSQKKPVVVSHYRMKDVPSQTEDTICVQSGLDYSYYDLTTKSYVGEFDFGNDVSAMCTYAVPSPLRPFISRPPSTPEGQQPNEVIASQDHCPANMTLEEYKSLCTVPLGRHIQWSNINVQLAMPSVDFRKLETTQVFLQCIYQTGPGFPGFDGYREAHSCLRRDDLAQSIKYNLNNALGRIKENGSLSKLSMSLLLLQPEC